MPLRPLLALASLLLTGAAPVAERAIQFGGFDRVRVQGPLDVTIAAGRAAGATVRGARDAIDAVEVSLDGATLTLRRRAVGSTGPAPATAGMPVTVTLATETLVGASVTGGGRLTIARMAGARVDVNVTGPGAIAVAALDGDAANATVIGNGAVTLAGRASTARLMTNGAGTIDADALDAGEVTVRLDGPGATRARARYTARVVDTGLGQVSVAGRPKCVVSAPAGGAVSCNPAAPVR